MNNKDFFRMIVPKISKIKVDQRNSSQGTGSNCGNKNLLGFTVPSTWPSSEGYNIDYLRQSRSKLDFLTRKISNFLGSNEVF